MTDNPVQDMTREINAMCKPDFMLNVTLNKEKEITEVFAGELYKAHDLGCAYAKNTLCSNVTIALTSLSHLILVIHLTKIYIKQLKE